jgi:hypothetical protein
MVSQANHRLKPVAKLKMPAKARQAEAFFKTGALLKNDLPN